MVHDSRKIGVEGEFVKEFTTPNPSQRARRSSLHLRYIFPLSFSMNNFNNDGDFGLKPWRFCINFFLFFAFQ